MLPRLAELFTEELTTGMRPDPGAPGDAGPGLPRAGLIKVAGNFHHLDAHARQTMIAAAEAHHATGAPIGVHHELGTAAPDVAELLCGQLQVPADKVILGHLNRLPDSYLQRQVAETGAFLAFDGPSRANHATDWRLHECLAEPGPARPRGPDPHRRRHHHGRGQVLDRRRPRPALPAPGAAAAAGGRTRRGGGGEVLHREPGPRLQLGLKAPAWAWAHWPNVRGSRPVTSRTSGWGCDSSSVPVT